MTTETVTSVSFRKILDDLSQYIELAMENGVTRLEVAPNLAGQIAALDAQPAARPLSRQVAREDRHAPAAAQSSPAPIAVDSPAGADSSASAIVELKKIAEDIAVCEKCPLSEKRNKTVPGQGCPQPEIMFVGEGPGEDEDRQGLAFVGRAGQLLTKMIEAMGCAREQVFIGNIVKCRPPNNRAPMPNEIEACLPYLKAQIALLKPKVIVALGATAVRALTGNPTGITRLRGQWLSYEGIDLMPTYHPSYLLRYPPAKREAWEDLKATLERLGKQPPPRKPHPS